MTSLGAYTRPYAVSGDGTTIVGEARTGPDDEWAYPAVWANGSMTRLYGPEGVEIFGWAEHVSADGSVIIGVDTLNGDYLRWEDGSVSAFAKQSNTFEERFRFYDLSADGRVLVGMRATGISNWVQGYLKDGQWTSLGILLNHKWGVAYDANATGTVFVGRSTNPDGNRQACRWLNGVPRALINPPGARETEAYHISDDGKVILGKAHYDDAPWEDIVLWKVTTQWNPNPVQMLLGTYPVGVDASQLSIEVPGDWGALSGDGATFGGRVTDTREAFLLSIVNMWGQYPIQNRYVDTTPWMGWLYVREAPWVWSVDLSGWLYVPIESAQAGQGWVFIPL
jgi:uncharacterized membrane protein